MVPVRFIAESLGADVFWQDSTQTVIINHLKNQTMSNPAGLPLITVVPKEGRRPVPISDVKGKSYDDLIFYDREFKEAENLDDKFNALPQGKVIYSNERFMSINAGSRQYGEVKKVSVDGMPFKEAWNVVVNQVPQNAWDFQLSLGLLEEEDMKDGDIMLVVLYMRTISTIREDNNGMIQCIVEETVPPNQKALQVIVRTIENQGWRKVYLPFKAKAGYRALHIRVGYAVQEIELGGYEIINYEDKVKLSDLPKSSESPADEEEVSEAVKTVFTKDEEWRKEAWNRIEEIRKGDINVIVKDAEGKPVSGVKVHVNMYEHEFQWGSMCNFHNTFSSAPENQEKYKFALSSLFNTSVLENLHKWNEYETYPGRAREEVDELKSLNIKYIRGHTLMWDRSFSGGWTSNTSIPKDVYELFVANDKEGLDRRIKEHILKITQEFKDDLVDWDVVNETLGNNAIRTKYGNGVLKDWFDWAREGAPNAKLYINETGIHGVNKERVDRFRQILDFMVKNKVDFDGIGIQGHFGENKVHPMDFYDDLKDLAVYGKEIKITEFDRGLVSSAEDREYEASFMRDIMIVVFSMENVTGFVMWGFNSGNHWLRNAPIFNEDWTLKESGRQYIDLVYNKWWTQESGVTDEDGKYSVRGYYGDYDITVYTDDGRMKTIEAHCYKGQDNTFVITLD